jgi:hypothetical protein
LTSVAAIWVTRLPPVRGHTGGGLAKRDWEDVASRCGVDREELPDSQGEEGCAVGLASLGFSYVLGRVGGVAFAVGDEREFGVGTTGSEVPGEIELPVDLSSALLEVVAGERGFGGAVGDDDWIEALLGGCRVGSFGKFRCCGEPADPGGGGESKSIA